MVAASTAPPAGPRIYTELHDGLIPLGDASRKYGCPIHRLRNWVYRGHLNEMGRIKGTARGGGYTLILEAQLQARVNSPTNMDRPLQVA